VLGELLEGPFVFAEGAAVIAVQNFNGQPIFTFHNDFVAIIKDRACALFDGAANDEIGKQRPGRAMRPSERHNLRGDNSQPAFVRGDAGQIFALEIAGSDGMPTITSLRAFVSFRRGGGGPTAG